MTHISQSYRPCVGLMIVNAQGKVFAGQRLNESYNAWQMPQGGIDEGEDAYSAALRELQEETGLLPEHVQHLETAKEYFSYDLPPSLTQRLWDGKYKGQCQQWYAFRFIGNESAINIHTEIPEFSAWGWMYAQDLMEKIVPFKKTVYEQVFAAFEPYLAKPV